MGSTSVRYERIDGESYLMEPPHRRLVIKLSREKFTFNCDWRSTASPALR